MALTVIASLYMLFLLLQPAAAEGVAEDQTVFPVLAILTQPAYNPAFDMSVIGKNNVLSNLALSQSLGPQPAPAFHSSSITCLSWIDSPSRMLISCDNEGTVKIWT